MDRANEQRKRLLQDTEKMLYKIKARMHGLGRKKKMHSAKALRLLSCIVSNTLIPPWTDKTVEHVSSREFNIHQALNTAWDLLGRTIFLISII